MRARQTAEAIAQATSAPLESSRGSHRGRRSTTPARRSRAGPGRSPPSGTSRTAPRSRSRSTGPRPGLPAGRDGRARARACVTADAAIRGQRPAQVLRRPSRRSAASTSTCGGRGLRPARAERRGQDDDGRDPRGLSRARRGRGRRCSASIPGAAPRALRERIGVVLQQSELQPALTVRETHRACSRATTRRRATSTR